jgi:hypothetical protein
MNCQIGDWSDLEFQTFNFVVSVHIRNVSSIGINRLC